MAQAEAEFRREERLERLEKKEKNKKKKGEKSKVLYLDEYLSPTYHIVGGQVRIIAPVGLSYGRTVLPCNMYRLL